eukprot:11150492-Alexandrium_andersonii.AAC.1
MYDSPCGKERLTQQGVHGSSLVVRLLQSTPLPRPQFGRGSNRPSRAQLESSVGAFLSPVC